MKMINMGLLLLGAILAEDEDWIELNEDCTGKLTDCAYDLKCMGPLRTHNHTLPSPTYLCVKYSICEGWPVEYTPHSGRYNA